MGVDDRNTGGAPLETSARRRLDGKTSRPASTLGTCTAQQTHWFSNPESLKHFFDSAYRQSVALGTGAPRRRSRPYNAHTSMEGMNRKKEPFSRLEHCFTVNKPTKQIGVSGPRVFEMFSAGPGGIFGQGVGAKQSRPVPPTAEQLDTEHVAKRGVGEGEVVVTRTPHIDMDMHVSVPKVEVELVPEYVQRCGEQADQLLLQPEQRRKLMVLEREHQLARNLLRKARTDRQRLYHLMRTRHPDGVLGVDSFANPESEVYGEAARRAMVKEEQASAHARQRSDRLAEKMCSGKRLGSSRCKNDGIHTGAYGLSHAGAIASQCAKTRVRVDTHDRLFGKDSVVDRPERRQHLWDQSAGGKDWDIVSHARSEVFHPKHIGAERVDRRMSHPSQQSLERGRNMQGFVERSARCTSPTLDPQY